MRYTALALALSLAVGGVAPRAQSSAPAASAIVGAWTLNTELVTHHRPQVNAATGVDAREVDAVAVTGSAVAAGAAAQAAGVVDSAAAAALVEVRVAEHRGNRKRWSGAARQCARSPEAPARLTITRTGRR